MLKAYSRPIADLRSFHKAAIRMAVYFGTCLKGNPHNSANPVIPVPARLGQQGVGHSLVPLIPIHNFPNVHVRVVPIGLLEH